jgi:hypothetical protein
LQQTDAELLSFGAGEDDDEESGDDDDDSEEDASDEEDGEEPATAGKGSKVNVCAFS